MKFLKENVTKRSKRRLAYKSINAFEIHEGMHARRNRGLRVRETTIAKKMKPVHPGEHLREDFLKPYGLSMNKLAMDLRVPVTRIADIVAERRGITSDTALRLGRYFKTSPEFWMSMQMKFELDTAEDELLAEIERDVRPISTARRSHDSI